MFLYLHFQVTTTITSTTHVLTRFPIIDAGHEPGADSVHGRPGLRPRLVARRLLPQAARMYVGILSSSTTTITSTFTPNLSRASCGGRHVCVLRRVLPPRRRRLPVLMTRARNAPIQLTLRFRPAIFPVRLVRVWCRPGRPSACVNKVYASVSQKQGVSVTLHSFCLLGNRPASLLFVVCCWRSPRMILPPTCAIPAQEAKQWSRSSASTSHPCPRSVSSKLSSSSVLFLLLGDLQTDPALPVFRCGGYRSPVHTHGIHNVCS